MTGPEHYREAERLTEAARGDFRDAGEGYGRKLAESRAHVALAAAQVHATLALTAAAKVLPQVTAGNMPGSAEREWTQVIGRQVPRCAHCRFTPDGVEGEPCEDCSEPLRVVARWEL